MEIQIQFARGEVLKEIKADGEPVHTVTLTPRFMTNHMRPAFAYVVVKGKGGREVAAVLRVDPVTGKIKAVSCDREKQPQFDDVPAVATLPASPPAAVATPASTATPAATQPTPAETPPKQHGTPPFRQPKGGDK